MTVFCDFHTPNDAELIPPVKSARSTDRLTIFGAASNCVK